MYPWLNAIRHQYCGSIVWIRHHYGCALCSSMAQCCESCIKLAQLCWLSNLHHASICMAQYYASCMHQNQSCAPWLNAVHPRLIQGWLHCMPTWRSGMLYFSSMLNACCSSIIIGQVRHIWTGHERCGLVNNAHAHDVQNGIIVDGVRGDFCHSSRKEAFHQIPTLVLLYIQQEVLGMVLEKRLRNILLYGFFPSFWLLCL